jgi:carbamoyl-phosphate synthase large subunit
LVLGSGAYRIGSSVEFDWCCVTAVRTLRERGLTTLMLNCNPETVSTDYDECDRLYFDEISYETVLELANLETLRGIVVSFGGQTPNSLVPKLDAAGLPIMGTPADSIDRAESRDRFAALCDELEIKQPPWCEATSLEAAMGFVVRVGYPVLVRPSYVLSGAAMAVVQDDATMKTVLAKAAALSPDHPVVLSKFVNGAKEIEIDGVGADGEIVAYAISEHVENAGVHSGDATLVLPPQRTYVETIRRARMIARRLVAALKISGPFNLQLLAKNNRLMVIECNVRSSRSFPFASKVLDINLVEMATRAILGERLAVNTTSVLELDYVGVKAPQFSFSRLKGVDPILGIEMASTGEVGCIGDDMDDALLKSMISVGFRAPVRGALLSTGTIDQKAEFLAEARVLSSLGVRLYATAGTADFLANAGVDATRVVWPLDEGSPNSLDVIRSREIDLVVNIPKDASERELDNDYRIRRAAIDAGVPLITNIQLARQFARSLATFKVRPLSIKSWREFRGEVGSTAPQRMARAEIALNGFAQVSSPW